MKLIYARRFSRQFFIVSFWAHCITLSIYVDMWFWFTEALPKYLPVYNLIIKIISLLPSNLRQLPPLMAQMFICSYFSLWAAVFWALMGGVSGLFLDGVRFFYGKKNINVKQMEAIKPIDAEKWTKWSFVFGFCLYFSLFLIGAFIPVVDVMKVDNLKWHYPNSSITLVAEFLSDITPFFGALFLSTYVAVIGGTCVALIFGIVAYIFRLCDVLHFSMKNKLASESRKALCFVLIFLAGSLIPGVAVAGDTAEERIGRGKTSSSFHYFSDVEYSYREVDLKRGNWDSRGPP